MNEAELMAQRLAAARLMARRFRGFLPVVIDVETGGFHAATDALLESHFRPATVTAFANTVCPSAAPARVAVSKQEKG